MNACPRPHIHPTWAEAAEWAQSSWLVALDSPTVLPFGLSLSPYVFTRLTGFLARLVRRRVGLEVAVYVDDFLLGGASKEKVARGLEEVRDLFGRLGVVLSDKIPAVPAQQADFLGFRWDAVAKEVQVQRRGGGSTRGQEPPTHPSQGPDGGPQWAGFSSCGRLVPPL